TTLSAGATTPPARRRLTEKAAGPRRHSSVVPRAAKPAENLPANGIVPVAKGVANCPRPRGPRPAAKHLVLIAEEDLRVLGIRIALEPRIPHEVARRPFPHVADHSAAPDWRYVALIRADACRPERQLIHVRHAGGRGIIAPRIHQCTPRRWIPRCRGFPLELRRQPLARPTGERIGFVVAHVTDRLRRVDALHEIHAARSPAVVVSLPILRRTNAGFLEPPPSRVRPHRTRVVAPIRHERQIRSVSHWVHVDPERRQLDCVARPLVVVCAAPV